MAPPHHLKKSESAKARYDKSHDIALLADIGMGYREIVKMKDTLISTVAGVARLYREGGNVTDTTHPRYSAKITKAVQQRVEDTVKANP